jgi:predicted ATP-dependent endonuclease of OLD family
MHIASVTVRNFRRLSNVRIDLAKDISIFVGANNSGKTSACQALQLFLGSSQERFSVHDFNVECWRQINSFGELNTEVKLPALSLDIWFHVEAEDLHRIIDLLPSLSWQGSLIGMRIEFCAADEGLLLSNFIEARERARESIVQDGTGVATPYHPWPRNLREYLDQNLRHEFELRYYVLDPTKFDSRFVQQDGYSPQILVPDKGRSGKEM